MLGHLYMHAMPKLRPDDRKLQQQRALQYFKLAVLQGSTEAHVQLANLLVDLEDWTTAASLYKEAYRAGSKDALFHLGSLYWNGHGVESSKKTAFALWQAADFSSKHAMLSGVSGMFFGVARFIVEFRAFLLFAAGPRRHRLHRWQPDGDHSQRDGWRWQYSIRSQSGRRRTTTICLGPTKSEAPCAPLAVIESIGVEILVETLRT